MLPQALLAAALLAAPAPEIRLERWPDGTPKAEYEVRVEADGSEVRHGPWTSWHADGRDHEKGAFTDGLRTGKWTVRWPNGKRRELGSYEAGLRVGAWKHYHESGPKAAEGRYAAGLRTGEWTFWDADREVDAVRSGTYEVVSRAAGAGGTVVGAALDGRPYDLWVWRRADGSLRLAGRFGVAGAEGPWVAAFADGSLDLDGQAGTYAAGERVGPLEGWPEDVEVLAVDTAPDPRRAPPLAVDAEAAARFEAWLAAEEGARESPLRALKQDPRAGFVACVAFLQGVDHAAPDERLRRVARDALPELVGVAFPLSEGDGAAAANARRALAWRDHVEFGDLDARSWRALFEPRWRLGPLALEHTPLRGAAEPEGWGGAATGGRRAGLPRGPRGDVKAMGGSGSVPAVDGGRDWLVRAQAEDGAWERGTPRTLEATAWALLAFAERDVDVYEPGPQNEAAARGLAWLIGRQRPDSGRYATPLCIELRSHALALWAAAELATLHDLPSLDASVARALEGLLDEQLSGGAFPRDVGASEPDVFATLYAGMALTVLEASGHDAARAPRERCLAWLEEAAERSGALAEPETRTPAATAASAFLRLLDGRDPDRDALLGRQVGWMIAHPSSIEPRHPQLDAEYLMFGAWTSHQVGGDVWTNWNKSMKIQLLQVQQREGDLEGSWEPLGIGPMDVTTVTAQRVLTFQTYYRYARRQP